MHHVNDIAREWAKLLVELETKAGTFRVGNDSRKQRDLATFLSRSIFRFR